ncbi:MAG: peptidoglycan DD-metalloendopeptidase family protein [Gammaproteobacteria bacterium]|nr:peptidoglycan DD-metalloendopeptidase family protein [Gammaproteobacteria bacterium]
MFTHRLVGLIGLACWTVSGWGQLPSHTPIPGGLAAVELGPADLPKPTAHFGQHPVLVVKDRGRWTGIVGLGLDIVPGRYIVRTTDQDHVANAHEFTVRAHRYRVTQPQPAAKKMRGKRPAPVILSDITYDRAVRALPQQRFEDTPHLPLRLPVDGVGFNDRFGEREVDEQTNSRPIRFLEFNLPTEHVVLAPGTGRVIGVLNHASGDVVAIDHGMGLLSILWPISGVTVKANENVARGANLGLPAPQSDSSTAQLRWSVALNREFVNPRLLIENRSANASRHAVSR